MGCFQLYLNVTWNVVKLRVTATCGMKGYQRYVLCRRALRLFPLADSVLIFDLFGCNWESSPLLRMPALSHTHTKKISGQTIKGADVKEKLSGNKADFASMRRQPIEYQRNKSKRKQQSMHNHTFSSSAILQKINFWRLAAMESPT